MAQRDLRVWDAAGTLVMRVRCPPCLLPQQEKGERLASLSLWPVHQGHESIEEVRSDICLGRKQNLWVAPLVSELVSALSGRHEDGLSRYSPDHQPSPALTPRNPQSLC